MPHHNHAVYTPQSIMRCAFGAFGLRNPALSATERGGKR